MHSKPMILPITSVLTGDVQLSARICLVPNGLMGCMPMGRSSCICSVIAFQT